MYFLLSLWILINVVCTYGVIIASLYDAEDNPSNAFFFPLLVRSLREVLNIPGTVIATTVITLFLLPAITLYLTVLGVCILFYFVIKGFVKLFKRKD